MLAFLNVILLLAAHVAAETSSCAPVLLQRQQSLRDHAAPIAPQVNLSDALEALKSNSSQTPKSKEEAEKVLKWLKHLFGEVAAENNVCHSDGAPGGLIKLVESAASPDLVSLDLTAAFHQSEVVKILVTAITTDGAYVEGQGFYAMLGENTDVYLQLELDRERSVVNVYLPQMQLRTSDLESKEAVTKGGGDGWLDVLPLTPCPAPLEKSIVVDATTLVSKMFYTFQLETVTNYRILNAQAFPQNLDLTVEYLSLTAPISLGFSLTVLPETPMPPRMSDDRLLYFTTDFTDIGYHKAGKKLPSEAVDSLTSMIWRWDLSKLPNRTIRMYVDPTVPSRWRLWIKEGVEAWNAGFEQLQPAAYVKAVLPEDADWPSDYDLADARYSTISWSIADEISSEGDAKVDPRTGEIIKADIRMGEGWVWAWLQELDLLAPNVTHEQRLALLAQAPAPAQAAPRETRRTETQSRVRRTHRLHKKAEQTEAHEKKQAGLAGLTGSLLLSALGPLTEAQLQVLMGEGLRGVIMHEMGHILGLRHNFKGSLGISLDCLKAKACTSEHGLSASVMDYVPPNLQGTDASSLEVDVFTPVVGDYDKQAIAYGYRAVDQEAWPKVAPELQEILNAAEQFEVCYDDDMDVEDPTCMAYDMSEDPIGFYEQEFARYVEVSKGLLEASVAPGEPLALYGEAVTNLLGRVEALAAKVVSWVGGIKDGYKHRGPQGELAQSRAPISRALQQRALALIFRLLRPKASGLLPPQDNLPYLVEGSASHDHVRSVDVSSIVHDVAGNLLESLLGSKRLLQIYRQQHLEGAQQSDVLSLDDMLRDLVGNILEPGLKAAGHGQDLDAQEMDLHFLLVRKLKNAYLRNVKNPKVDVRITKRAQDDFASKVVEVDPEEEPPELPEHISSKLLYYLQSARQLTKNSLEQLPHNTEAASFWKPCGDLLGACVCTGLARLAVQGASSAIAFTPSIAVSDVIFCHNSSFPQAVLEDGARRLQDSDSWCECLSLDATGPSDVRTHLALLHREFADVFCEGSGGCSEARVSLPLAPAPPVDMRSPFKATDAVAESPKSKLTIKWFIIGISSALGIIFLSFVSYRLRYHGAIHG
mmetsp:Transcript_60559/g.144295  ORF Transcript_60559/g.144295 Transcript_60559/m.144295 type:complete len:1100 (-) Transcript_60559:178-3477(-)